MTLIANGSPPGGYLYPANGPPPYDLSGTYTLDPATPPQGGDTYCSLMSVAYSSGYVNISNPNDVIPDPNSGRQDNPCDTVTNRPFFKAYDSGISAGGEFTSVSSGCIGGGVLGGWNNDSGLNPDFGASTELHTLALGKIIGVASNQSRFNNSPTGLSFANSVPTDIRSDAYSPLLGGKYNTTGSHCLSTVAPPTTGTTPVVSNNVTVSGLGAGSFTTPANTDVTLNGGPPIGTNTSIFVNGNAYISSNIMYSSSGGSWNLTNVPSFVLHATGDIYISPSVKYLDGIYISEKSGGTIYTCGTQIPSFAAMSKALLFDNCNNQLTVHGSFVADHVNLMRTYGSLRDETPIPASGGTAGAPGAQAPLKWSNSGSSGAGPSDVCTQIVELSDPYSWNNFNRNELCVPGPDTGAVQIGWDFGIPFLSTVTASETHCTNWGSVLAPTGYPVNTVPGEYYWNDDRLCSNVPINFVLSNSSPTNASQHCTNVTEMSDLAGGGVFQNASPLGRPWVCIAKFVPTIPGGPASPHGVPPCSNDSVGGVPGAARSFTRLPTCAAEVFDFSPELYLADPKVRPPNNGAPIYKAITGLPPVL